MKWLIRAEHVALILSLLAVLSLVGWVLTLKREVSGLESEVAVRTVARWTSEDHDNYHQAVILPLEKRVSVLEERVHALTLIAAKADSCDP